MVAFAIYAIVAWSIVGVLVALLTGRALARCTGEQLSFEDKERSLDPELTYLSVPEFPRRAVPGPQDHRHIAAPNSAATRSRPSARICPLPGARTISDRPIRKDQ